jgi:serine/threonine-protein kinase
MNRPEVDVVLGGRYRLREELASGGMGTVWAAEDETLGRRVAVKILNEGLADDPRFIERFRREARAAAGLSHPNLAGVFDYGDEGSRPYIVMELVDGETLADRLARSGPLAPAEAAEIAAHVADALAEAHAGGVIHRDIKPANVMLSARGPVKVMDFGIASSSMSTNLTATGTVVGTARYLSPEQARGERATPASDLYALGILLYEMLTGAAPFDLESPVATAMAHVGQPARPVREVRADIPPDLAALVDQCLEKDPSQRPPSAEGLAADLRAAPAPAEAEPTVTIPRDATAVLPVEPPPPPHRAEERRRRGPWPWLVPIVLSLALVAAVVAVVRSASAPPARVEVPSFEGMGRVAAQDAARDAGLTLLFTSAHDDTHQKGRVISQSVEAGALVARDTTLTLVLSLGPELATVPDLTQAGSAGEVVALLEAVGLRFKEFVEVRGEPGIVGSDPAAGEEVPKGTEVTVFFAEPGNGGNGGGDGGDGKDKDRDND